MTTVDDATWLDVRWRCGCGRFVADREIRSEDSIDPSAYYGVTSEIVYDCKRCGRVEPQITVIAERRVSR